MKFMMLIHHDDGALAAAPQQELWAEYGAFNAALAKATGCAAGERLRASSTATTVRQHDGRTEVLDGPYADTKEQFGGYFLIDVADLDAALKWAARCPAAEHGVVEVRPLWEM
jgi:hypothetical protein